MALDSQKVVQDALMQSEIERVGRKAGLPIRKNECCLKYTCEGLHNCDSSIIREKIICPYEMNQEVFE